MVSPENDRTIPMTRAYQELGELGLSPDQARRTVLRAGPEVSERRGRERFVSYSWLTAKKAELERGAGS